MGLLAAGASRRFGDQDKLTQPFRGKKLGEHVCEAAPLEKIAPGCATVITSSLDHPCAPAWREAGFNVALNSRSEEGMGTSVALAASLAMRAGCDALLIALADMPLVPRAHFEALIDACMKPGDLVCSASGEARMPPAVFGADRIAALTLLAGDTGARALLAEAQTIACPAEWLADIDTPEALARLSWGRERKDPAASVGGAGSSSSRSGERGERT